MSNLIFRLTLFFFCCLVRLSLAIDSEEIYYKEKTYLDVLEKNYHGLLRENETFVELTPVLRVNEEKICDVRIVRPSHNLPFKIFLNQGLGVLKATHPLDCEKRKSYNFEISAIFCDGAASNLAHVHISVVDVNEYAPIFLQPSYVTEVDEGRLYQEILRVEAKDKDCSPLFGDVCKYAILNQDQPFTIDSEGSIRNTEVLSHRKSHNHILEVVAFDCSMKESAPIMISIKVRKVCEPRFLEIPERIDYNGDYSTSTENLPLFPNIKLDLCDFECNKGVMELQTSVNLQTKHIFYGCDRDTSKCSKHNQMLDLLALSGFSSKSNSSNLVDFFDPVYHFDGASGAIVEKNKYHSFKFDSNPFSLSTIFKHFNMPDMNKHTKEHIVCVADDHKMNRHHFALFVRNCRLILLLRKDFAEGDLNIFSPAEWRWKLPQVCDGQFHHYVLNVAPPSVSLFIDGVKYEDDPEIIDDWPLHKARGINTTLTVGACVQGSEEGLRHGFHGDIAQVHLLLNETLNDDDLTCAKTCAEYLVADKPHQLLVNSSWNEVKIQGSNKTIVENYLQKIQYVNRKPSPTVGRRNIQLKGKILCDREIFLTLPEKETYVMVQMPTEFSRIFYSGKNNHLVTYPEIKRGVKILSNLNISLMNGEHDDLDFCTVNVFPSLNSDHEELLLENDENLGIDSNVKALISKDGVELKGRDGVTNYVGVLKSLVYTNKKPAYYLNRVFKLSCAQLNAQFKNYEYVLTLTVLHPKQMGPPATVTKSTVSASVKMNVVHDEDTNSNVFAHAMVQSHNVQEPHLHLHSLIHKAQSSHSTILIIAICVFFVILLVGISIVRLKSGKDEHESFKVTAEALDWDDSALTITINPMQDNAASEMSDNSSESEDTSDDDDEDGDITHGKYKNISQLEWDNSTM